MRPRECEGGRGRAREGEGGRRGMREYRRAMGASQALSVFLNTIENLKCVCSWFSSSRLPSRIYVTEYISSLPVLHDGDASAEIFVLPSSILVAGATDAGACSPCQPGTYLTGSGGYLCGVLIRALDCDAESCFQFLYGQDLNINIIAEGCSRLRYLLHLRRA